MNQENYYNYNVDDIEDFEEFEDYYGLDNKTVDDDGEPRELNFG